MVATFVLAGCATGSSSLDGSDTSNDSGLVDPANATTVEQLVDGIQPLTLAPEAAVVASTTQTGQANQDGSQTCAHTEYRGVTHYQQMVSFDPNADALFPGGIVQGKSLAEGLLAPVGLQRAPGTITLTGADVGATSSSAKKYSRTLKEPTHAAVEEAIHAILSGADINFAAKTFSTTNAASSLEEGAFKAGIAVSWLTDDIKSSFASDWSTAKSSYLMTFNQSYFTISFDAPSSPTAVFDPSVLVDDARHYMGVGNPAAYVSSVTYGRMLLVKVESDKEKSTMDAALSAGFSYAGVGASGSLSSDETDALNNATMTVFALGGSAADVARVIGAGEDKVAAIGQYLQAGANFDPMSPGVPIGYTVRYLRDSSAVKVAFPTDYSVPNCDGKFDNVRITLQKLQVIANDDKDASDTNFSYSISLASGDTGEAGDTLSSQQNMHVSPGDEISLNVERYFKLAELDGTSADIVFTAQETDVSAHASRTHTYVLSHMGWSQSGLNTLPVLTGNDASDLNVQLIYSWDVIP